VYINKKIVDMRQHLIAPSVLAADFKNLAKQIELINDSEADWFHVDVMDGVFVPNISFGMFIIKVIKEVAKKPLDVHLMIVEPERYIQAVRDAGADIITVHYEACPHIHRTIQQIKETGAKAGVAINPGTPVSVFEDILEDLDLALIMSVNPGFGGQKFIYRTLEKTRQLKERITIRNTNTLIEIDGGVGLQNAEAVLKAGADVLVAGSSVYKSDDPVKTVQLLKGIIKDTIIT